MSFASSSATGLVPYSRRGQCGRLGGFSPTVILVVLLGVFTLGHCAFGQSSAKRTVAPQKERPDIACEIVRAGHVVGNHTFTHPLLTFKSVTEIRTQLEQCRSALRDAISVPSSLFRPPFGARRPAVLRVAREIGLAPVMWNVTSYDWTAPPAAEIERNVARQIHGGDVILLHDGGHQRMGADRSQTAIATDRLIARYKSEGYEFVTVPQMMRQEKHSAGNSQALRA